MARRAAELPRVRVAAVILLDGKLVVVRHRMRAATYHLLPGGGIDYGETIAAALMREVREETGLLCKVVRPLFISDTITPSGQGHVRHIVNLTFLCEATGGQITDSPLDKRVEAVELIDPAHLPELDLRPPFARELSECIASGCTAPAVYLGSLWRDES